MLVLLLLHSVGLFNILFCLKVFLLSYFICLSVLDQILYILLSCFSNQSLFYLRSLLSAFISLTFFILIVTYKRF
jgi:hypothetical protein